MRDSEQPGGELLAILRRSRVVRAHQLEDVHELLTGIIIGLDPVEQRRQRGIVVIVGGELDACLRRDDAGAIGFGDPREQCEGLVGLARSSLGSPPTCRAASASRSAPGP